eukprot:3019402-Rhodomonas_salina.2
MDLISPWRTVRQASTRQRAVTPNSRPIPDRGGQRTTRSAPVPRTTTPYTSTAQYKNTNQYKNNGTNQPLSPHGSSRRHSRSGSAHTHAPTRNEKGVDEYCEARRIVLGTE